MTAANIFTIPPGLSFVDMLARGILEQVSGDPLALAAHLILLPNRRSVRTLREAFLRLSEGRPTLLPRMMVLGDMDEDEVALGEGHGLDLPPAISGIRRQLLLARLIMAMGGGRGGQPPSPDQAAHLAAELGKLLDQVQNERLDFADLARLVPDDYASHWQITLDFLKLLTEHWPAILADQGGLDAADRRNKLLEAQARHWQAIPPDHPVIAAGITGSVPAAADLLATVARLPRGRIVLPGLDRHMDEASWAALDETHPQFSLKRLLDRLGIAPGAVRPWAEDEVRDRRAWLISEAMRPAATTEAWRDLPRLEDGAAIAGVTRLDCPTPREEAGAIALMMRECLETEGRTAALVTPDRDLARRVAAELGRWGIGIDDSAGHSLRLSVPGVFLALCAEMVAEDFAPHKTLAALKHPLAAAGRSALACRLLVRRLERIALRGPRPAPGIAGLRAAVHAAAHEASERDGVTHEPDQELLAWLDGLEALAQPLVTLMTERTAPLADLVRAHMEFAESLAQDDETPGPLRLWKGEAGTVAAQFAADLAEAAPLLPPLPGRLYPALLETLMTGVTIRPAWGGHPRLHILGPLEARLHHPDLMILGGLNEGTWPPDVQADPWMSRPMREKFGLAAPEQRIGLSAHDFAQAFCAPQVVITRAQRVEGTPTVPSRWLLRLETVMEACGLDAHAAASWSAAWIDWSMLLDKAELHHPARPPAPRPPLAARPRRLSVTQIETWMRDPYAVYARHILKLEALDPIDADPGASDYGNLVHKALELFTRAHPHQALPADAEERLLAIGREVFAQALAAPGIWAFWWPRFERIAQWFVAHERGRRDGVKRTFCEVGGALEIDAPGGPFRLTAKADRIDVLADGTLALIDYKTGAPPSRKEVAAGYAPQLPLEAVIARHGGFRDIPAAEVAQMLFWRLRGGDPGGEEQSAGDDSRQLAAEAMAGLAELIRTFDDENTAYEARPHPERAPKYSDYLHLARVKEWASGGEDEE